MNFKKLKGKSMLTDLVSSINSFLWGPYFLIALLCGTGLYFTIRLRFVQIFKFKMGLNRLFGNFSLHGGKIGHGLVSGRRYRGRGTGGHRQPRGCHNRAHHGRAGSDILDVVRGVFRHGDEFRRDLSSSNLPYQGRQRTHDRRAGVLYQSRAKEPLCQGFGGIFCAGDHFGARIYGKYGPG